MMRAGVRQNICAPVTKVAVYRGLLTGERSNRNDGARMGRVDVEKAVALDADEYKDGRPPAIPAAYGKV
jgi:hypothetical protein